MSILIKGMEMPKNCNECDFCHWSNLHQTGICDRCGDEPVCPDFGTDYKWTRARFCPLIELPEKHGRLVDADAMCNDLATVDPQYKTMIDWCIRVTEAQPTIIEAEGDEE